MHHRLVPDILSLALPTVPSVTGLQNCAAWTKTNRAAESTTPDLPRSKVNSMIL